MFTSKKIIYWLSGSIPTEADRLTAFTYGPGVVFRNSQHVPSEGALEACDACGGDVPERYAAKYPVITCPEDVAKVYNGALSFVPSDDVTNKIEELRAAEPPKPPKPVKAPASKIPVWEPNR